MIERYLEQQQAVASALLSVDRQSRNSRHHRHNTLHTAAKATTVPCAGTQTTDRTPKHMIQESMTVKTQTLKFKSNTDADVYVGLVQRVPNIYDISLECVSNKKYFCMRVSVISMEMYCWDQSRDGLVPQRDLYLTLCLTSQMEERQSTVLLLSSLAKTNFSVPAT